MTIKSRIFTILTVVAMLTCTIIPVNAAQNTDEYIEHTETIYFDNINVAVKDNEELLLTASNDANVFTRISANKDIDTLNEYFEKYEATEATIAEQMSKGTLYALSYTETPLVYVEDHYERATTKAYTSALGTDHSQGYLTICSMVLDSGTQNAVGDNLYLGLTIGEWTGNNLVNGETSPASGYDSVIQVMDEGFTVGDHLMGAEYKNLTGTVEGVEGQDFHSSIITIGNDEYLVHYKIKDDPLGTRRLASFSLTSEYFGAKPGTTRSFYSVYIHTWKEIEFDFSIMQGSGANIELGTDVIKIAVGGERTLLIDPSIAEKSWALAANVAFDF